MEVLEVFGFLAHLLVLNLIQRVAFSQRGVELGQVLEIGELLVELAQRLLGGVELSFVLGLRAG
jgi:hypothetical protein